MSFTPYLTFKGDCEEAFRTYAGLFGAEIEGMMTHAESPQCDQVSEEWHDKILHACLVLGDFRLMGSDPPPDYYEPSGGMAVSVTVESPEEAERVFQGLAEGGTIFLPMEETFWAERFGMVTDRFGIRWMVNCFKQPCTELVQSSGSGVFSRSGPARVRTDANGPGPGLLPYRLPDPPRDSSGCLVFFCLSGIGAVLVVGSGFNPETST